MRRSFASPLYYIMILLHGKGDILMSEIPKERMSNDALARQIMETMQESERAVNRQGKNSGTNRKKKKKRSYEAAEKKPMSAAKAVLIAFLIILMLVILLLAFLYFKGLRNAQGKFLQNTYINQINVSELTEAEAYERVKDSITLPKDIVLVKLDGSKIEIPLESVGYQDNIKATVGMYMSQQNYYTWFTHLSGRTDYNFDASFKYDNDMLIAELKRRIVNSSGKNPAKDAYIKHTGKGFEIVKEVIGDNVDESKLDSLVELVTSELAKGKYEIDLAGLDLYQRPKVVAADLEDELEHLESIDQVEISIDFDFEKAVLKGSEFKDWITYDEENALNGFTVDKDKVMQYVEGLAKKYDTYNTVRDFKTTNRGKIKMEQGEGCYGYWLYQEKMCDKLVDLIQECDSCSIDPIYYVNPYSNYVYECDSKYHTAKTDLGKTYCEVDLTAQHFWYYEDGKMKYDCDIVSGKPTEERNTPAGIYKVWLKELNKVLSGSNAAGDSWSTPCTYWNNISTFGVGLHDANWRGAFGGDIYKYDGSHGCINMPVSAAKYVYDNVPIGTPVVMYW